MSDFIFGTAIARGDGVVVAPFWPPFWPPSPPLPARPTTRRSFTRSTPRCRTRPRTSGAPAAHRGRRPLQPAPVEIIGIDPPAPPKTAAALKTGIQLVKSWPSTRRCDSWTAAAEAAATGGAGLSTDELSDLYLNRAMAIARADWKPERSVDEATRARAYEDYVRAADLDARPRAQPARDPPQVLEDWRKAVAEVRAAGRKGRWRCAARRRRR